MEPTATPSRTHAGRHGYSRRWSCALRASSGTVCGAVVPVADGDRLPGENRGCRSTRCCRRVGLTPSSCVTPVTVSCTGHDTVSVARAAVAIELSAIARRIGGSACASDADRTPVRRSVRAVLTASSTSVIARWRASDSSSSLNSLALAMAIDRLLPERVQDAALRRSSNGLHLARRVHVAHAYLVQPTSGTTIAQVPTAQMSCGRLPVSIARRRQSRARRRHDQRSRRRLRSALSLRADTALDDPTLVRMRRFARKLRRRRRRRTTRPWLRVAQPARLGQAALEHCGELARMFADEAQDLGHCGLQRQRCIEIVEQVGVADGDRRLLGEGIEDVGLAFVERAHLGAIHPQHPVQLSINAQADQDHAADVVRYHLPRAAALRMSSTRSASPSRSSATNSARIGPDEPTLSG